ncbi:hypothetical protein D3C86_1714160 [compost metagenome]
MEPIIHLQQVSEGIVGADYALAAGIIKKESQLFTPCPRVDRHKYCAGDCRGQHRFDELDVVGHQQGETVARLKPQPGQAPSQAVTVLPELPVATHLRRAFVTILYGQHLKIRILQYVIGNQTGEVEVAGVGHYKSSRWSMVTTVTAVSRPMAPPALCARPIRAPVTWR